MPIRRTTFANPNRAQRKGKFVIENKDVLRRNLKLLNQIGYRKPAQIHKRLRLCPQNIFPCKFCPCRKRPSPAIGENHTAILRDAIHSKKASVVRRELILDTGVAEPDDQLHAILPFQQTHAACNLERSTGRAKLLLLRVLGIGSRSSSGRRIRLALLGNFWLSRRSDNRI